MSDAPIIGGDALRTYVFGRKLHSDAAIRNEQLRSLEAVHLHHGYRAAEIADFLDDFRVRAIAYTPEQSSETHYYDPNNRTLHVPVTRGQIRLQRDVGQAKALRSILGRDVTIDVRHYGNDPWVAAQRIKGFAAQVAKDAVAEIDPARLGGGYLPILIGPFRSIEGPAAFPRGSLGRSIGDRQSVAKDDYLNYRVLREVVCSGTAMDIINLDYIFADQAQHVLSGIYERLSANVADGQHGPVVVDVWHYGKVGILDDRLSVGDICVPQDAMDEEAIAQSDRRLSPLHNRLAQRTRDARLFADTIGVRPARTTTVNTSSVLDQTRDRLAADRRAGGQVLDMEWMVIAALAHGASSMHPGVRHVRHHFAGVGSDKPLAGETLGDTPYPIDVERRVAQAMLGLICGGDAC